jgi:hypothetical protein
MSNLTKILEATKARQAKEEESKKSSKPEKEDDNKSGKEEKVPAGGKTLTDQQHNEIDTTPIIAPLKEEAGKHAVVTFGRMNPPTLGHEKLVDHVKKLAAKHHGEAHVYLSHTQGNKKNPLSHDYKHKLAREAFGDVVKHIPSEHSHMLGVAKHLDGKADHLHMVVGSDRVAEATKKLHAYNGKEYNYKSITVHSAGGRDPDAEGAEGMSASKMRAHAAAGDHDSFKSGLPKKLHHKSHEIMKAVSGKTTIGEEIAEALTPQQRMKRAIQFKRIAARVKMGRKRAQRRRAPKNVLVKRARRLAIKFMRQRVMRGQNYKDMPYATRAIVDKRLHKRKKSIGRIAQRLMPKVARAEAQRKLGGKFMGIGKGGAQVSVSEEALYALVESMMQHVAEDYDYELLPQELNKLNERALEAELPVEMLESVFRRGLAAWQLDESTELSFNEYAFNRVNSFLAGGAAWDLDADLFAEACDDEGPGHHGTHVNSVEHGNEPRPSVSHRSPARPRSHKKELVKRVIIDEAGKSPAEKLNNRLNKLDPGRQQRHKELAAMLSKMNARRSEEPEKKPVHEEALGGEKRRVDMPQLTNFDAFHKDLTDSGHQLGHEYLKPDTLEPMQKHFNQEKVDKLKQEGWGDKAIIVSADNHVIDGHHRWVAAKQMGTKIKARVASLKSDELLDFVKGKPYVETKKLDEAAEPMWKGKPKSKWTAQDFIAHSAANRKPKSKEQEDHERWERKYTVNRTVKEASDPHAAIHKKAMDHYDKAGQVTDRDSSNYHHHMANHHDLMAQYTAAHGKLETSEMHHKSGQKHVRKQFGLS